MFEIIWPEQVHFPMGQHESFFLWEGEKLYFSKWYEEGDGPDYRYWEETVIRDLGGNHLETLSGDVRVMPNGEVWHLTGSDENETKMTEMAKQNFRNTAEDACTG